MSRVVLIEENPPYGNPALVHWTYGTWRFRIAAEIPPLDQVVDCGDVCCDVRFGEEIIRALFGVDC